jgi:phosphoglucomutase
LRKKTSVFRQPHYTEAFTQSILSGTALLEGALDGRFLTDGCYVLIVALRKDMKK